MSLCLAEAPIGAKRKPRKYQLKAIEAAVETLKQTDRAKVIMPCGTGKTLVGFHVRWRLAPKRSLIVAPSLALIKQLLDEYDEQGGIDCPVMVVCHDDSTVKKAREKYNIPNATTDPVEIRKRLKSNRTILVFCTYQSTPRLAEAYQSLRLPKLDFGLFDEAHRMAGRSKYGAALSDGNIPIAKRLFMTATPRVATKFAIAKAADDGVDLASMDDESQFGPEAFCMSFNDAIAGGHLTDYQVAVFVIKESEIAAMIDGNEDARELAKRVALMRAMAQHDIRKVLAYHKRNEKAKWFADVGVPSIFDAFQRAGEIDGTLWSKSLSGADKADDRVKMLDKLKHLNGDSRAVLSNCEVLQEGVDCPSVDAVCLIEPRTSPINIVQIIGRAIRKSPNKKIATIVLPVFMPADAEGDIEGFVASSEFAPVWDTLAALKSHDNRVEGWVSSAGKFGSSERKSHIEFNVDLPAALQGKFADAITSRVVSQFTESMRLSEDLVWQWMQDYFAQHKKWPSKKTKSRAPDGSSWGAIDLSLRVGTRGLQGGLTIASLKKKNGLVRICLTEDLIWGWMQEFFKKRNRWPTARTEELTPDGSTWNSISQCLTGCRRGLRAGLSLRKFRKKMLSADAKSK